MKKPLISVVIPTYNRADWISEAVDSVLGQTFKDLELIIIDDGSKDSTDKVLKKYGSKIRYFYQENAGLSDARNKGILASQGDYIAFLDSDDVWFEKKLETQINELRQEPRAVMHVTNALIYRCQIGTETNLFDYIKYTPVFGSGTKCIERPFLQQIEYSMGGWPQNVLVKREILLSTELFRVDLKRWQDMALLHQIAAKGPWVVNSTPFTKLMRRKEDPELNLSDRTRKIMLSCKEMVAIYEKLETIQSLNREEHKGVQKRLSNAYSTLGFELLIRKEHKEARRELFRGFLKNPGGIPFLKLCIACLPSKIAGLLVEKWRKK